MTQMAIPLEVEPSEVLRKKSLGGAIELCLELAGLEPKVIMTDLKLDKAQFSRWTDGKEGVVWPKMMSLMDRCGNDAPVLWMAAQRNFDLHAMRRLENETERENRLLREEVAALRRSLQRA